MSNRRKFIKQLAATGVAGYMPSMLFSQKVLSQNMIWANMLSLHYNRSDNTPPEYRSPVFETNDCRETWQWARQYRSFLTFDETVWNTLLEEMAVAGMNMVVLNIGDGIKYECHPEIAVENAWTHEKLKSELKKMRKLGLEPIPKMNFSTTHDLWLGEYARMISTDKYYEVCRNLIREVCKLFDYPRFFHLGMDEETANHQKRLNYAVMRQNDLWWGDFYFLIGEVEKNNVRPWIWSDYAWQNPDVFFKKMPKSVLQSNWYYGSVFDINSLPKERKSYVKLYNDLEKYGYDQIPTGSNHSNDQNFELTVEYCKKAIDPSRLFGFMTAPWRPTLPPCLETHKKAIAQVSNAKKKFYP